MLFTNSCLHLRNWLYALSINSIVYRSVVLADDEIRLIKSNRIFLLTNRIRKNNVAISDNQSFFIIDPGYKIL